MSRQLHLFILYDDNTPSEKPPFTNDCSTWDLRQDYNLSSGLDNWFIEDVLGCTSGSPRPECVARKGIPPVHHRSAVLEIADDEIVGWIGLAEIDRVLSGDDCRGRSVGSATSLLLSILRLLGDQFGADRVRVVFSVVL